MLKKTEKAVNRFQDSWGFIEIVEFDDSRPLYAHLRDCKVIDMICSPEVQDGSSFGFRFDKGIGVLLCPEKGKIRVFCGFSPSLKNIITSDMDRYEVLEKLELAGIDVNQKVMWTKEI